jgi:amino acid adenylation domain-containing protein
MTTEGNSMVAEWAPDCIHAELEQQVARTPDRIAVLSAGSALTYAALDRRANVVARQLERLGVGPDTLVGIAVPRGADMVVAVLAALKAGGAYVPLDPAYPRPRLEHVVSDARLGVVLTTASVEKELRFGAVPSLRLDRAGLADDVDPGRAVDRGARPESLAYVIYTSGSTGAPKGVMIEHRQTTTFFRGMDRLLGGRREDATPGVWLAATSLSFDISVLELLWTLTRGFTVVVQTDEERAGGFAAAVAAHGVTHFQCTPSMVGLLLADAEARRALGALEAMLVGGEALPLTFAQELAGAVRGDLLNMYGPTETTVWSTSWRVDGAALARGEPVSIGSPLPGTTVHVLDEERRPVPAGREGELYIGGSGVARGYLRRPELTDERFLANPSGPGRLYKTGDVVRTLADGRLEFLGRRDHQVKIRGHRVELGEIEHNIREVAGVHEVVVVARQDGETPEGQRLVAYVAGASPTASDLRRLLRERLPEPMVPSEYVVLDRLPLTPNGKIDRNALPRPDEAASRRDGADDERGIVAPNTPTERVMAQIWCEILGLPRVSIHDNFFDLGGHSLLSPRVMYQIEVRLRKRLNVSELILQSLTQVAARCDEAPEVGKTGGLLGVLKRVVSKG